MNEVASRIQIGRRVRFHAGYGNVDGDGLIVAVHGEPNPAPAATLCNGIGRILRRNDCTVDVILFDGRRLLGINQCGIDSVGIGVKLMDRVHGPALIEAAKRNAAKVEADNILAAAKAKHDHEVAEASRVITDPPVFYWNGIKDAKGEKLQKCWYSRGPLVSSNDPDIITIYARDYCRFSDKVRACFDVENDTDTMVDYFESDRIRVLPCHPLYGQVAKALEAQEAHRAKVRRRA